MDVRIDFTGESDDAQRAALGIDAALESIEKVAREVTIALAQISIDLRQVLDIQAGSRTMAASLRDVTVRGTEAAEAVSRVGRGYGRQVAEVVAGNAAISASLLTVQQQAVRANQELSGAQSLIGAAARGPGGAYALGAAPGSVTDDYRGIRAAQLEAQRAANGALMMGGIPGDTYRGPIPLPRASGSVGDNRDFNFGNWAAQSAFPNGYPSGGFGGRRTVGFDDVGRGNYFPGMVPGAGNFGLETSGRRRLGGFGPIVGGAGSFFGGGLPGRFGGGGSGGGGGFGGGGGGGFGGLLAGALPGGARATPAALATLSGAGLAAAPNILPGLIAPLAAIPGLVGTGVAAIGALVAAFHGVGAAIGGDVVAYKALNAEQQQFVLTARGLSPILNKIRDATTSSLLPGATAGLQQAFSPRAQSTLTKGLGQIGGAIGGGAQQLGGLVGSQFFTGLQADLFRDGAKNIRTMADAFVHLLSAATSFAHGAQPITDWLVRSTDLGARWLANWARMKDETNAFDGYLKRAKQSWENIIGVVFGFGRVIGDLAGILGGPGQSALTGLIKLLDGLDHWLKTNQAEMKTLATTITGVLIKALTMVVGVIKQVADGLSTLIDWLGKLPDPVQNVVTMAAAFATAAAAVGLMAAKVPLLGAALLTLAKNPEILGLLAGVAALGAIASPGSFLSSGGDPNAGGSPGNVTAAEAHKMLAAAGNPKPFSTGGGTTAYQLGNGQLLSSKGGVWSAYYQDNAATVYGTAPGYKPPKGVGVTPRASAPGTGGHGYAATGEGQVYPAGKNVDLMHEDPAIMAALNQLSATSGVRLQVTSGYRSYEKQKYLWDHAAELGLIRGKTVAAPGHSDHETGRAADVMAIVNGKAVPITQAFSAQQLQQVGLAGIGAIDPVHVKLAGTTAGTWPPGSVPTAPATVAPQWQLPLANQIALARAQTTKGTGDDLTAIAGAMKATRGAISGGLGGADLVNAYQELKSLQDMLASIAKAKKSNLAGLQGLGDLAARGIITTRGASQASLLSAGRLAGGLIGDIGTAQTSGVGLGDFGLAGLKGQAEKLRDQLAIGLALTPAQVATIRQKLLNLAPAITSAIDQITAAAQARSAKYKTVFENLAQQALDAFSKVTNDVLAHPEAHADILPLTAQLLGLQDAHTQQALQDQLAEAQQNLAKALAGATEDSSGILSRARDQIGRDALAHAIDVAQSAILGGTPMDMTDRILKNMQAALAAATGMVNESDVVAAQKAVTEAQYQITVNGLEKVSRAETDAYQQQRSDLQAHLQASLSLWETFFSDLGHNSSQALADLNSVLASFGLPQLPGSALTPNAKNGPPTAQDWMGEVGFTPGPGQGTYSPGIPADMLAGLLFGTPGGINPNTGQPYVGFADGGISFNPSLARVSEKGAEAHLPLNDPRALAMVGDAIAAAGGAGDIAVIVNVQDDMLKDLIDVQVVRATSKLDRSIGVVTDTRRRAGRFN